MSSIIGGKMSDLFNEIDKRRTFAIISHPDAGKTTLTEKLLLYGGAINLAGSVKGKRTAKHAGWKLKNKEVFLLLLQSFSLNIKDIVSTFWIHPDTKTSQKILIEH